MENKTGNGQIFIDANSIIKFLGVSLIIIYTVILPFCFIIEMISLGIFFVVATMMIYLGIILFILRKPIIEEVERNFQINKGD